MMQRKKDGDEYDNYLLTSEIMDSFRRLVSLLHLSSRATEKELGLSAAQLFVLKKLSDGKSRSLGEIAKLTHTHQSSVSVVVRKLVEKRLVLSRSAKDDARRYELRISGLGCRVLERSPEAVQDRLVDAFNRMSVDERKELNRLLLSVVEKANVADKPATFFFEDEEDVTH